MFVSSIAFLPMPPRIQENIDAERSKAMKILRKIRFFLAKIIVFFVGLFAVWITFNVSDEPYKNGKLHLCVPSKRTVSCGYVELQSFLIALLLFLIFFMVGRYLYKLCK